MMLITKKPERKIQPLGISGSIVYFGIPTILVTTIYWLVLWISIQLGIPPYYGGLLALLLGISTLWIATLIALRKEGYSFSWNTLTTRLRWRRMTGNDWLWSIIIILISGAVSFLLVGPLNDYLLNIRFFPIPDFLPASDNPYATANWLDALETSIGGKIVGNFWPAITLFFVNLVSVLSEELWWRGIVLPRQEAGLGRWAWVVHGLLWAPFHLFKYWNVISLFGITLGLAYLGQRSKNTTPVFLVHFFVNVGTGVIGIFLVSLGMGIP